MRWRYIICLSCQTIIKKQLFMAENLYVNKCNTCQPDTMLTQQLHWSPAGDRYYHNVPLTEYDKAVIAIMEVQINSVGFVYKDGKIAINSPEPIQIKHKVPLMVRTLLQIKKWTGWNLLG